MNIHFKELVKGSLIGESGYTKIASTPEVPVVSIIFEEKHGQNSLSPNFASLFAFRTDNAKSFSVVHIQGQHNGIPGRMYDTRIFYDIEMEEIRKTDSKLGTIIGSLPKMGKYNEKEMGSLKAELQIKEILEYDSNKVDNLCEYIIQAIVESKYLLIKLDDSSDWLENEIFENIVSKSLFAAIDKLPEKLRPAVSFALSVDDKYNKEFLEDLLVLFYHGNNNFGFKSTIEIDWKDLNNKAKTNYLAQSKYFSDLVISILNGKIDFYDTNFTSNDMALKIYDANKTIKNKKSIDDCNTDAERRILISLREVKLVDGTIQEKIQASRDLLKTLYYPDTNKKKLIEKLSQDIFTHFEIKPHIEKLLLADLNTKIEKGSLNLSDIFVLYKYFQKENITEIYAKKYFDKKISTLKIEEQIKIAENAIHQIPDKLLSAVLETKIIGNILQNFSVNDWFVVAEFIIGSKYEQNFKEKTQQYNLQEFEFLLKDKRISKYNKLIKECLYNSNDYRNNSEKLCVEPFVNILLDDKLKSLRAKMLPDCEKYKHLYKDITFDEIDKLSVTENNDKYIIRIIITYLSDKSKEFISKYPEIVISQIKYELLNSSNVAKSDVYSLYQKAGVNISKPPIKLELQNYKTIFRNANDLNFGLTNEITELYTTCRNIGEVIDILQFTKQMPDSEILFKFKISAFSDVKILKSNNLSIKKENIDLGKMITNISSKKDADKQIRELLIFLKENDISFEDYKKNIKQLSSKIHDEFFNESKYTKSISGKNTIKINFKKGWELIKTHKSIGYIIIIAFIIGYGIGFYKGKSFAIDGLINDSTKTPIDTLKQDTIKEVVNDTIYINYYKGKVLDANFKISDSTIYTLKLDTIHYKNLLDSANKKMLSNNFCSKKFIVLKFRGKENHLNFQVDGKNSNKMFYQKIDSLISKK